MCRLVSGAQEMATRKSASWDPPAPILLDPMGGGDVEHGGRARQGLACGEKPPLPRRDLAEDGKRQSSLGEVLFFRAGHTGGARSSQEGPSWPQRSKCHPIPIAWRAFPSCSAPGSVPCIAEMRRHACFWSRHVPRQNQGSREDQAGGGHSRSLGTSPPPTPAGTTTHRGGLPTDV